MTSCLCVCRRAYLQNGTSDLHQHACKLLMAVVRSSSPGGVAIRYVLPVSWMKSCLHKMGGCSTWLGRGQHRGDAVDVVANPLVVLELAVWCR